LRILTGGDRDRDPLEAEAFGLCGKCLLTGVILGFARATITDDRPESLSADFFKVRR
jgi:hypothetical protein